MATGKVGNAISKVRLRWCFYRVLTPPVFVFFFFFFALLTKRM